MLYSTTTASLLSWVLLQHQHEVVAFSPVARTAAARATTTPTTTTTSLFEYIDSNSGAGNLTDSSFDGPTAVETTTVVEPLSLASLGRIADNNMAVETPTYDISQVSPGILHLGESTYTAVLLVLFVSRGCWDVN